MPATQQSTTEHNGIEEKHSDAGETVSLGDNGGLDSLPPPPKLSPEQEMRLYRKIDVWLLPILTMMYLASFLDRGMSLALDDSSVH